MKQAGHSLNLAQEDLLSADPGVDRGVIEGVERCFLKEGRPSF